MLILAQVLGLVLGAAITSLYTFLPAFRNLVNALCVLGTAWFRRLADDDGARQRVLDDLYSGAVNNQVFEEIRERTRREVREALQGTSSTPHAQYHSGRNAYILRYRLASSDSRYELVVPASCEPRSIVACGDGDVDCVAEAAGPLGNFHGMRGLNLSHFGVKEDVQLMDSTTFSSVALKEGDDVVDAVRRGGFAQ